MIFLLFCCCELVLIIVLFLLLCCVCVFRGYIVSPFGQDGFAILTAERILESLKIQKKKKKREEDPTDPA